MSLKKRSVTAAVIHSLSYLSPLKRRFLLIAVDTFLLPLAVWLCFWLRLAHPFHPSFISAGGWLLAGVIIIGLPICTFTGQYKGLTRYVGSALYHLVCRNGLLVLFCWCVSGLILGCQCRPAAAGFCCGCC